ncbi:hypothetical protein ACFXJO_05635 [Streptomyces lavendulae]|uniref:hypothetical protein n=1 Tax=Streptomyces lavendulae TaxID=1914 RepID=UPI0036915C87
MKGLTPGQQRRFDRARAAWEASRAVPAAKRNATTIQLEVAAEMLMLLVGELLGGE